MHTPSYRRYDRTLRVVMWLDAFLSLALVAGCVAALPVVAVLDLPHQVSVAVGLGTMLAGVLLAGFGAVTGVALLLRMNGGDYTLPAGLRLPLPRSMRPDIG